MLSALVLLALGDGFDEVARPFLDQHCLACHDAQGAGGGATLAGGLDLRGVGAEDLAARPDDWEWLLERVEFEEMPPTGHAQPGAADRAAFVDWLRGELVAEARGPLPLPRVDLRRLTAAEYSAAVRDLFGTSFDASRVVPEDAVGHGFDHVGAAQTLSEAHFVQYLRAAESVARRAIPVNDGLGPRAQRFVSSELEGGSARGSVHWRTTNGAVYATLPVPRGGQYIVRAEVFGSQAGPDPCRCALEFAGTRGAEVFDVEGATLRDVIVVEEAFSVERGGDLKASIVFLNDYFRRDEPNPAARDRNLAVRWIEVEGPIGAAEPTPFLAELLATVGAAPSVEQGIASAVASMTALVWRQPSASEEDVARLLELSLANDAPAMRLRSALVGLLASPRFLFREEAGRGELDDRMSRLLAPHEQATRLAGFLWRTVPERTLLARAAEADLASAGGVAQLAAQMLGDPRAEEFVASFAEQWLQLRALERTRADRKIFPDFSTKLRASMLEETRLVLLDSFRERRSLWELIDGAQTFADARLAELYGLDADALGLGDDFERVDLSGTNRRGLLGHGSVLFLTSEPTRTSPVKRGKWVLDVLLGSPPPPPPPGADNLPEADASTAHLPLRERLEAHRADPNCAACHQRMDPLGFGLEAFDGIGAERAMDDPGRGDLSATLPDGRSFDGPVELFQVLRGEDRFLEALVERMMIYALGRGLERADRASVAAVLAGLDPEHPTLEQLILGVVRTPEFRRVRVDR